MKLALFRADGSRHLGIGHIMRCLALARGFEKIGVNSIFAIRDYDQEVTEMIRRYGYTAEMIVRDCSLEEDASLTSGFADRHGVSLIVTDLCNTDILKRLDEYREYLQRLKDAGHFLMTIDDLTAIPFPSDIVVNSNCGAEGMKYDFGHSTKFLLGTGYFIFRPEFVEAAKSDRKLTKEALNILVTMGGSDALNLTAKVVSALCKLEIASNLNVRITLGVISPDSKKQELEKALKSFTGRYQFIRGSDNIGEAMLWSDLAITADGLTKYETSATGTPSIIISSADRQSEIGKEFEKKGSALHLGPSSGVDDGDIAEAIEKLLRDHALRNEMSKRGKKLVDGGGIERIISAIHQEIWA